MLSESQAFRESLMRLNLNFKIEPPCRDYINRQF